MFNYLFCLATEQEEEKKYSLTLDSERTCLIEDIMELTIHLFLPYDKFIKEDDDKTTMEYTTKEIFTYKRLENFMKYMNDNIKGRFKPMFITKNPGAFKTEKDYKIKLMELATPNLEIIIDVLKERYEYITGNEYISGTL